MTRLRPGFGGQTLADREDRARLWGLALCAGLALAIGFVLLQLAVFSSRGGLLAGGAESTAGVISARARESGP